jgi:V/A-type H+/Na+-transporting ATPase subunit E
MAKSRHPHRDTPIEVASGVEALIARLRQEGVNSGHTQAEQIVADAEAKAAAIVNKAQQKAEQLVGEAKQEAENLQRAGQVSLEVAFRDATLSLKSQLTQRFAKEVQHLVGEELQKPELLQRLILEVFAQVKAEVAPAQQVEVLLPEKIAGLEELRHDPEELEQGTLTHFVRLVSRGILREGVSFGVAKDNQGGLKLRLLEQSIVLDLSDRAVAATILEHLQPRFRALLEGIVK